MPRRRVNNESDAANLLADSMARLVRNRGDNLNGNDLHALNAAVEMFLYAKEVHRVVDARRRTNEATGQDPVQLDIERAHAMKRLKRLIDAQTGPCIPPPRPSKPPLAKPQPFRTAEKNLKQNAQIRTGLPDRKNKKVGLALKPKPKRNKGR